MRVTIRRTVRVADLLDEHSRKYGSLREIRAYLKKHPRDRMAKVALHDLQEYHGERPDDVITETRTIVIPDSAIDELTVQRLQLLLILKSLGGSAPSVRNLAQAARRDVKNVSEDVAALADLGLLDVERAGRGRPRRVSLHGTSIELHLLGSDAETTADRRRSGAVA